MLCRFVFRISSQLIPNKDFYAIFLPKNKVMQIAVVRKLASEHSLDELKAAEEALMNEQALPFEVGGSDEGEQLTHVLSAMEILQLMQDQNTDLTTAIRTFSQRVRTATDI